MQQIPEDPELRRDWNLLVQQMEEPEIFFTFEWALAVQRAYCKSLTPVIFLAYDGDRLVGVVALAKRATGETVFLASDTGDYCDFLSASSVRHEFVSSVFAALKNRTATPIVLTNVPADSASVSAISDGASMAGYRLHMRPAYACARVVLGNGEEREAVKQSVLAKKRLRRNMRELQKRGQLNVDHEAGPHEIESLLEPFSYVHVARFLETGKISSLVYPERRAFLRELTREAGRSRWVTLSRLRVGNVTAAWHFGFRFAGTWFWYQPTVDRLYGDFSPGYCLLAKIIELACDSPDMNVVDLGLGAEGYKDRFATATRQTLFCELNDSFVDHLRAVTRHCAVLITTASPRVEKHVRSLRSLGSSLAARLRTRGIARSTKLVIGRLKRGISSSENVLFFKWPPDSKDSARFGLSLRELDSQLLGASAIRYGEDRDVLRYLMRSAQRFEAGSGDGYILVDAGIPVHFCWVRNFEGFHMAELDRTLEAPSSEAAMIFDCYTPAAARGRDYFSQAITLLANRLRSMGKTTWIFGAETNDASLRGIRRTSFEYKFTLGRKTNFFRKVDRGLIPKVPSNSETGTVLIEHSNLHS
jgi:CelD/BcsL family acetyltransferase involved in cellulose biosynthesis